MPKQLTIRGVPEEVAERLAALARERGSSMNAVVLGILAEGLGFDERRRRLERYASWVEEDRLEFEAALEMQRPVDDPAWR